MVGKIGWRAAAALAALAVSAEVLAHFVFIVPLPDGTAAKIIMSETLTPGEGLSVERLGQPRFYLRTADGKDVPLNFKAEDTKSLRLETPGTGTRVVHGKVDWGLVTRGANPHVLLYYPKTILGDPFDPKTIVGGATPVEIVPVAAKDANGVRLKLLVEGKPKGETELTVVHPDGAAEKVLTDKEGLTPALTDKGRYGAWARFWEDKPGERDGKPYAQLRHYATLVFDAPSAADPKPTPAQKAADSPASEKAGPARPGQERGAADDDDGAAGVMPPPNAPPVERFADLPFATASFGAAASEGWLYIYGGHVSKTHAYHTRSASGEFWRVDPSGRGGWQQLPGGPALQGMNLAACDGQIYRVGGMQSLNPEGARADSRSVALCARFDPATRQWHDLPPLPEPRSSHDVVVVDKKLYVVGGWQMRGPEKTLWPDTMLVLDLTAEKPQWTARPQPFQRRALVAAVLDGRIYVIGGFDPDSRESRRVDVCDPRTATWSQAAELPAPARNGFAPAACVLDGALYVSVSNGGLHRLNRAGTAWELVTKTTPRLAHRMAAFGTRIFVIGGATRGDNLSLIETVAVAAPPKTTATNAQPSAPRVPESVALAANVQANGPALPKPSPTGQKFCPIMTDQEIDADSPTVEYRGRQVALCCETCVRKWERDPDAYASANAGRLPQLAGLELPARALKQVFCPVFPERVICEKDLCVEFAGRKIYLFDATAARRWKSDPAKYADVKILPQLAEPEGTGFTR